MLIPLCADVGRFQRLQEILFVASSLFWLVSQQHQLLWSHSTEDLVAATGCSAWFPPLALFLLFLSHCPSVAICSCSIRKEFIPFYC